MTSDESRALILKLLGDIAPEADLKALKTDRPLREQIEIDSIDFLGLVTKIHKATGIDVPEADYAKLDTLDRLADYLSAKAPEPC
jgi:acyl carrier protein